MNRLHLTRLKYKYKQKYLMKGTELTENLIVLARIICEQGVYEEGTVQH